MNNVLVVSNIALWVVVIFQTLLILALYRYFALLLNRLPAQGLQLGKKVPPREITFIDGSRRSLGAASSHNSLLIFTSPRCPWCETLAPDLERFGSLLPPDYQLWLILGSRVTREEAIAYAKRFGFPLAIEPDLMESYAVPGTRMECFSTKKASYEPKGSLIP
jgi:thiol-disulfide isomerase/thioredoxin